MKAFLVVVGILMLAGTAGADYKECREAYRDKQWDQAFEACHAEAVKADKGEGDKRAFLRVAHLYMRGRGTGRDYDEAMRWFRKAADRGSGRAMSQIGYLYKRDGGLLETRKRRYAGTRSLPRRDTTWVNTTTASTWWAELLGVLGRKTTW